MSTGMRALRLGILDPRAVLALAAGRFRPDLYRGGPGSPLRLVEVPPPERPAGWVRVAPTLSGICGSDLKTIHLTRGQGTTVMALFGMPRAIVLGHEVVGTVLEADAGAGVSVGDRVVVDPTLSCQDKDRPPCARCAAGHPQVCERIGLPSDLGPGNGIGYHARFGGGWAEGLVAPPARVHRVPDVLDDRVAVLAEPTAVTVQAVLRDVPAPGARVLVIGPGAIGLSLVHALHVLAPEVEVTVAALAHHADELARAAGATSLLHGTRRRLVHSAGDQLGTPVMGNALSGPVLGRGFDVVYDTVGSFQTIDDGLRMTRPRGRLVLLATANRQTVDWTLVWSRDLTVQGTFAYGDVDLAGGARRHAIEVALDVLAEARPALVTHVFPLEEPVEALRTAESGPGAGAVRVAFAP